MARAVDCHRCRALVVNHRTGVRESQYIAQAASSISIHDFANSPHANLVMSEERFSMTKLFRLALFLALPFGACPADPALLQMVMPDAQVVAGLQVTQAKSSPFGQFVLSHLSINDTELQQFTSQTGFDPRRDVTEIVIASNWKNNTSESR